MRKLFLFLFLIIGLFQIQAQIKNPVKWTTKIDKISENEFLLIVNGAIDSGWHLYSQFTPDNGPLPMTLSYKNTKGNYELIGKTKESTYKKQYNDIFEVDEYYFETKVQLTQKVKIVNPKTTEIDLHLEYQVCKDACINDKKDFLFTLPKTVNAASNEVVNAASTQEDTSKNSSNTPQEVKATPTTTSAVATAIQPEGVKPEVENQSNWSIFFYAFLGGFAALLTPCVFPMIPMTVSFFTKQSKTKAQGKKNALIYGIAIILIYVVLGLAVTAIFGAGALNALSTNVYFNLAFFVLLVFFASSFLGAFEIMLPNSWANKIDSQADRGGVIGILFMALALAIVSFSCTGPIVGTVLVQAASNGGIAPILGMFGFSLALALPFMVFALFPGWLNSLPKSGGWLNTVKVFLGFLELALAFKFLSNADLVLQMHLLEREVFIAIWIAIFGTLALYLFGKITLPHDSPLAKISVGRLYVGLFILAFTVYLIPGLWGAPLQLINAFPPPLEYSESPSGLGGNATKSDLLLPNGAKKGPHNLIVFDDYEIGLAYAKKVNKPILLDFTGHACVNCRKMENTVWIDPAVLPILKNDVVLISLYVDDKRELPETQQTISKTTGAKLETIGEKWTDFMISKYKTNTQPLYVMTDLQGNNLNKTTPTTSYNPDSQYYKNWLEMGIKNFKK
ncbi:cytochrome c biogenesis protein CcdA [Flavobacterium branchiophilum]|uniref:Thiol:disulfide interchange protein DsbD n=1 Tax=Flavobacterium branchiophilum (strain FL-15) TaxID=1034807 RepID=G2Z0W2_FLABF|nr:cytochrome c biogenesis protein CcdA [Flavobacterium branchiophilum]CCB69507.1 Thiol:disulfide interchange protein DsbD precursor [Flavobacterium branchiophilum FL-15]